jgi:very-short-patch-repair endonuclease
MPSRQQHNAARRLRGEPTAAERKLWRALRHDALGVRFRRQHPIPPYFADFAAPGARLVVEVDGGQHGGEMDAVRDAAMGAAGWRVLRFWNNEVMANLDGVVARIIEAVEQARD